MGQSLTQMDKRGWKGDFGVCGLTQTDEIRHFFLCLFCNGQLEMPLVLFRYFFKLCTCKYLINNFFFTENSNNINTSRSAKCFIINIT
jgi:hypothetical protein